MNKKLWLIAGAAALIVIALVLVILFGVDWTPTVGICYRDGADPLWQPARQVLEQYLMDQGYEVIVTDAASDQALQNRMIAQLKRQGCDLLIVEPVLTSEPQQLQSVIADTALPCVLINRPVEDMTGFSYVGIEATRPGAVQGEMLLQLPNGGDVNGDGTVCYMVIQGPQEQLDAQQRTVGLETALEASTLQTQLLSTDYGDWSQESGTAICSRELAIFGKDIEVIFCGNDAMAVGAAQAVSDGGWTVGEDVYLFGIGGDAEAQELIQQGGMTGTVSCDSLAFAQKVLETVLAQSKGTSVVYVDCTPITQ